MIFRFKQFDVEMTDEVFKIGTDASLLGAIPKIRGQRLLEIGTGTGVVSLMIAQRYPQMSIDAIDISENAIRLAQSNFDKSPFENLKSYLATANNYTSREKYDVIISNPPYHLEKSLSDNEMKNRSKSEENLPISELVKCILENLSEEGSFLVIAPPRYIEELSKSLNPIGLYAKAIKEIRHHEGSKISRQLVCYTFEDVEPEISTLVLYEKDRVFTSTARVYLSPYLTIL